MSCFGPRQALVAPALAPARRRAPRRPWPGGEHDHRPDSAQTPVGTYSGEHDV